MYVLQFLANIEPMKTILNGVNFFILIPWNVALLSKRSKHDLSLT